MQNLLNPRVGALGVPCHARLLKGNEISASSLREDNLVLADQHRLADIGLYGVESRKSKFTTLMIRWSGPHMKRDSQPNAAERKTSTNAFLTSHTKKSSP